MSEIGKITTLQRHGKMKPVVHKLVWYCDDDSSNLYSILFFSFTLLYFLSRQADKIVSSTLWWTELVVIVCSAEEEKGGGRLCYWFTRPAIHPVRFFNCVPVVVSQHFSIYPSSLSLPFSLVSEPREFLFFLLHLASRNVVFRLQDDIQQRRGRRIQDKRTKKRKRTVRSNPKETGVKRQQNWKTKRLGVFFF